MSKESLQEFMEQLGGNEELLAKVEDNVDVESLVALGVAHGFDINVGDFEQSEELSDGELDQVAGGLIAIIAIAAVKDAKRGDLSRLRAINKTD